MNTSFMVTTSRASGCSKAYPKKDLIAQVNLFMMKRTLSVNNDTHILS